ncbi:MAG: ABC transporter permease [Chloroflexota bacterium]
MKAWNIAVKDMLLSLRNTFGLLNMFVLPLVITGLIYFAFGGFKSTDAPPDVQVTKVVVVNHDQAVQGFRAGDLIVSTLGDQRLAGFLAVSQIGDEQAAHAAVDRRQAGVAVIIPAGLTASLSDPGAYANVVVYKDPTLTLGPGIVQEVVGGVVTGLSGSKIAAGVASEQLAASGAAVSDGLVQDVVNGYVKAVNPVDGTVPGSQLLSVQAPGEKAPVSQSSVIVGGIMAGLMIFYAFFTGGNSAMSIIREEEEGTLQRLFTTPTSTATIYAGKLLATLLMVAGQVIVLQVLSALFFGIRWGDLPVLALLVVALDIAAAGFGLFWMSLARNRKQAGAMIGGVFTAAGMLGGLFTVAIPNPPALLDQVSIFVPQGWAIRGWTAALNGGGLAEVITPAAVMAAMGLAYFAVGTLIFRRRFA